MTWNYKAIALHVANRELGARPLGPSFPLPQALWAVVGKASQPSHRFRVGIHLGDVVEEAEASRECFLLKPERT
jgi:hypothetical protein